MAPRFEVPKIFRIKWPIRLACILALLSWVSIALVALTSRDLPFSIFAAIAFFVSFFVFCVSYYSKLHYVINEYGIILMSTGFVSQFDWSEIEKIEPSRIPSGGYIVTTERGGFVVNGFIDGQKALVDLIIARAGLFPL